RTNEKDNKETNSVLSEVGQKEKNKYRIAHTDMESGKMVPEPICRAGTTTQTWRRDLRTQPGKERRGGLREGRET
ncbi:hypothetical protein, partial [Klebsiella pneumoniae]|uniref:hypothetical protein n=1 Tax=Klebsiella pneumoniae TaxID=573 RepID=UPI0039C4596A